ncbi:MAG: carboxypeptidase-like regulatory domain-containing protein [Rhodothermales bacterium]
MVSLLQNAGFILAACLGVVLLSRCSGAENNTKQPDLTVTGIVIMPDSSLLFGAEISTEPPTGYVSTDEEGRFGISLPRPAVYTFIATHPDARYRDMEGRITEVQVDYSQTPYLVIMLGRSQRMPLMNVDERAPPALRHGKKRTGH